MSQTSKTALAILFSSLILGVLGDGLLRAVPWGINVVIWVGAIASSIIAIMRWRALPLTGGGRWLIVPAIVFATTFAWRDSVTLQLCNLLAVWIALGLVAHRSRRGQVRVSGVLDYTGGLMLAAIHATFGAFALIFEDIQWKLVSPGKHSRRAAAVTTGVVIAFPLLIIFGRLLTAADAAFDQIVRNLFDWDIDQIASHTITIGFWSWIMAGFLHQTFLTKEPKPARLERSTQPPLGIIEIGTVLALLNGLFFAFVVVQFRYFFGGEEALRSIGWSYAEYARRGFFELVTVAALVLPVLLAAHHLLRVDDRTAEQAFRILAGTLIALLFVIMISAFQRMRLYQQEFGLTELRLYTTAFMGWLAIVFVWFIATVLRGQRERFVFGALLAGFAVLIGLNAVNPDDFIVRTNTGRVNAPAQRPFDASYVVGLSADAVPALIEALPTMMREDRCLTAWHILERWTPPAHFDWLTWNWSRLQAWSAVNANQAYLHQVACPQPPDRD